MEILAEVVQQMTDLMVELSDEKFSFVNFGFAIINLWKLLY